MRKRDLFYYMYDNNDKDYIEISNRIIEIIDLSKLNMIKTKFSIVISLIKDKEDLKQEIIFNIYMSLTKNRENFKNF